MSQSATDLILYKKTEVLLHETYPVLRNFPKAEKFSLCQEIKQAFYSLLKYIILANNVKTKRRLYQEFAPYPYIKVEGEMKFGERRLN